LKLFSFDLLDGRKLWALHFLFPAFNFSKFSLSYDSGSHNMLREPQKAKSFSSESKWIHKPKLNFDSSKSANSPKTLRTPVLAFLPIAFVRSFPLNANQNFWNAWSSHKKLIIWAKLICRQFHKHFMSRFGANILAPKKFKLNCD